MLLLYICFFLTHLAYICGCEYTHGVIWARGYIGHCVLSSLEALTKDLIAIELSQFLRCTQIRTLAQFMLLDFSYVFSLVFHDR